ncbi:MAG: 30S ribosomal protein S6 [Planctomycetes bacterium]|nr:30S ribosomal protein S6 [Planctomycetota bacterium]
MAAKVYECMFVLDTSKVAGDVPAADKALRGILEKHNAEVLVSRPWDERRLTYPIRNQKKGLYYLTYFSSEGKNLAEIEHDCALNEMILRMMVLRIDPKLVDTMLSIAKGEHAVALHNIQEEPGEGGMAPSINGMDEGPRRKKAEARE